MKKKKKREKVQLLSREKVFHGFGSEFVFRGFAFFSNRGELSPSFFRSMQQLSFPLIIQLNVISVHVTQFKYLRERMYEQINK